MGIGLGWGTELRAVNGRLRHWAIAQMDDELWRPVEELVGGRCGFIWESLKSPTNRIRAAHPAD
jgi:hypothetical protein